MVYVAGRGATAATLTPYDVAAVRSRDGTDLAGTPPDDLPRYLDALRADRSAGAAAIVASGEVVTAEDVGRLVERIAGMPWADAERRARAAGALLGAYPAET